MNTLVQKNCKACGGIIDDPKGKFCPHCASALESVQTRVDEKNKKIELCPNCGSPVTFNIEKQQFACDYCQSTFSTQQENELANMTYEAEEIITFQVPEGMAKMKFYEWLTKASHIPLDILQSASNITLEQVYIPYIFSSITFNGTWGADIGYDRQEQYTANVTKEREDGTKYTEKVTKTRTVTDWKYMTDQFTGDTWKSTVISESLPEPFQQFIEELNLSKVSKNVSNFDEHYTAGTKQLVIVPAKVDDSVRSIREFVNKEANEQMKKGLPGDDQKNEKITAFHYDVTSKYVYVPFWKISYQYAGVDYSAYETAYDKKDSQMKGITPVNQEHSAHTKKLGTYGWLSLIVAFLALVPQFLDINQTVKMVFLPVGVIAALICIFSLIKYLRFSGANKQQLKDSLNSHSEYQSLRNKYGNEA